MGKLRIPYVEKDGILYPLLTIPADKQLSEVGKYGLLWLSYMKENHKGRYRTLARLGCINRTAQEVNEEAYEMLEVIVRRYLRKLCIGIDSEFYEGGGFAITFVHE